jgi:acetyl esterase/lipase
MSWQNAVLSLLLRFKMKPMSKHALDVAKTRALADKPVIRPRLPKGWRLRESTDPSVRGEWVERENASPTRRLVLYLHGGGYFFCSPRTHRPITYGLAAGADVTLFALDYRLAPEHRFPAALDDAVAAYRTLVSDGFAPERIAIAGDSAGGGLALATLLALRDAGTPLPAAAVLFSPWTDLAATGETLVTNDRSDVMFYGRGIAPAARYYLGDAAPDTPLASPLYGDLQGLPPLLIQASDSEVLLDDSRRLAEKAARAGVPVEVKTWRKTPHAWQLFSPFLPEARAALSEAGGFIRRHLR